MSSNHSRPDGVSDKAVEAAGKMSEALEAVERARGHLYDFHQLMGGADLTLGKAVELMAEVDSSLAAEIDRDLVGRNVLDDRWTFQIVEEFDDIYWSKFRELDVKVRERLVDGKRHVFEAEMKGRRHTDDPRDPGA